MSKSAIVHTEYLLEWMKPKHYEDAGIDLGKLVSVIPEPVWFDGKKRGSQHTLCDFILLYEDGTASAAEMKGSKGQRPKAISQIKAGNLYIKEVLEKDPKSGLFIV
jgi:hypothetical protein